jgi:hypothetical protein
MLFRILVLLALISVASRGAQPPASPLLPVLSRFTAPDVPTTSPAEVASVRTWPDPSTPPPTRPGQGLAQHPMLYAGEGYNVLFLVNDGKVIWSYSRGPGGEIDDVWLLSNGHILFARQHSVEEVTPDKKMVWHYDCPAGTEIHSAQPLGLDRVLMVRNGLPPKAIIVDKATGQTIEEHEIPITNATDPKSVHTQFRRIRMTANGTYLLAYLKLNKVVEYDRDFKEVWSYEITNPWAATRLHNGNTLIVDEHDRLVREVNSKKETVWEFTPADLPPDITFKNVQTAERLANGNTVIFSSTGGVKGPDRLNLIQAVEVTPAKKIVWVLQDWKDLGPATTAQFLDQPGTPEIPGSVER